MLFRSTLCALISLTSLALSTPLDIPSPSLPSGLDINAASANATQVIAQFVLANAASYTPQDWIKDITLASSNGIDGFAVVIDPTNDALGPLRLALSALEASALSLASFKFLPTFNMTGVSCSTAEDAVPIRAVVALTSPSLNQLRFNERPVYSTIGGEQCTFGAADLNEGWTLAVKESPATFFMPAFDLEPTKFCNMTVMDGAYNYNSSMTQTGGDPEFGTDQAWINGLCGKTYMSGVAPWLFAHYPQNNIYGHADNHYFARRWQLLVENRNMIQIVQLRSWNNFGESSYVGPIAGNLQGSDAWVEGFDHQAWLGLNSYYASAMKTGTFPDIQTSELYLWGRLYPKEAKAADDTLGRPTGYETATDAFNGMVFTNESSHFTGSCGSYSFTAGLNPGVFSFSIPFYAIEPCNVTASLTRDSDGQRTDFDTNGLRAESNPTTYNFNALVMGSGVNVRGAA